MTALLIPSELYKEPEQAGSWGARPFPILSLFDMLRFPVATFALTLENLALIRAQTTGSQEIISDTDRAMYRTSLEDALDECAKVELPLSVRYLKRLKLSLGMGMSYDSLSREIGVATDRITDELHKMLFVHIPASTAKYYTDDNQFGKVVADKFPKTVEDIQESAKCLAFGRYTASVFHLMRVMESAVQYLGKRLSINLVTEKAWHNIIEEVDKAIKGLPIKQPRQKALRNRLAEASAHLRMVKDAWRNDVMHPKETYTEEEAERVFRNVKDFMVHLATKI